MGEGYTTAFYLLIPTHAAFDDEPPAKPPSFTHHSLNTGLQPSTYPIMLDPPLSYAVRMLCMTVSLLPIRGSRA